MIGLAGRRHYLLIGTGLAVLFTSPQANAGPVFPSTWTAVTRAGIVLTDSSGDIAPGHPALDIVGDSTNPAAFFSSDGTNLYFRLRVDGNPAAQLFGWGVQISMDGNDHNFEYTVVLNGQTSNVDIWRDTGRTDSPSDASTLLSSNTNSSEFVAIGDGTFFIDFLVPYASLNSLQFGAVSSATPLQFVFGSNSDRSASFPGGSSSDILEDEAAGSSTWHVLASDAVLPAAVPEPRLTIMTSLALLALMRLKRRQT